MRLVWIAPVVGVLAVLAFIAHTRLVQNPRVVRTLTGDPGGELAARVLILELPSGKSIPVNYLVDPGLSASAPGSGSPAVSDPVSPPDSGISSPAAADRVYVASDFFWWRELRGEGARVAVEIRGERRTGRARVIEDDPDYRNRVFEKLRPTAPRFFGVMVEIALDPR